VTGNLKKFWELNVALLLLRVLDSNWSPKSDMACALQAQ
jgi:hypothetical protein